MGFSSIMNPQYAALRALGIPAGHHDATRFVYFWAPPKTPPAGRDPLSSRHARTRHPRRRLRRPLHPVTCSQATFWAGLGARDQARRLGHRGRWQEPTQSPCTSAISPRALGLPRLREAVRHARTIFRGAVFLPSSKNSPRLELDSLGTDTWPPNSAAMLPRVIRGEPRNRGNFRGSDRGAMVGNVLCACHRSDSAGRKCTRGLCFGLQFLVARHPGLGIATRNHFGGGVAESGFWGACRDRDHCRLPHCQPNQLSGWGRAGGSQSSGAMKKLLPRDQPNDDPSESRHNDVAREHKQQKKTPPRPF
jgi:hypothetical protein